ITHLTLGGGNRIGALVSNGAETVRVPARGGQAHARNLIRTIAQMPRAEEGTAGDLSLLVDQLRRPPRRRGLALVVSDFLGDTAWQRPLRGLSARHDLIGVERSEEHTSELQSRENLVCRL